jgi:hypothetical protein
MYESARQSRLTADWYSSNTSEDAELSSSLRMLRQRSRAVVQLLHQRPDVVALHRPILMQCWLLLR